MKEWRAQSTVDFEAADPGTWVAILPVSATEQHGPHLPVATDTIILEGMLEEVARIIDPALPALLMPHMPIGKSNEHAGFAGTLTLSTATLIALWTEIGKSVFRSGLRKMIIVNSHGGQPQVADIVARDLRVRLGMLVVVANAYTLGMPKDLFDAFERRHGIHGGEIETSQILYLDEAAVRKGRLDNFVASSVAIEQEYEVLRLEGGVGIGWQTQDVHVSGAVGNAAAADAERGREVVEFRARRFVKLIEEVSSYPLDALRAGNVTVLPPQG